MSKSEEGTQWKPEVAWIRKAMQDCLEICGGDTSVVKFVKEEEDLDISDLSDGNLNHVLRVSSKKHPDQSVILKHAPPYIKILGPAYPLADSRGDLEYRALVLFDKLCPGSVVKPLGYHPEHKLLCMVDYRDYVVYRGWLLARHTNLTLAKKLARDIATVHNKTHVATLGKLEFAQMVEDFRNPHLSGLTDDYIFTKPFTKGDPTNHWSSELDSKLDRVYGNPELLNVVRKMHKLFQEKKEALLHGDLHTGSALVDPSGKDIRMFDVEFAMVGPCAFDLGLLVANYVFLYYHHMLNPEDNDARRKETYEMVDILNCSLDEYLQHMTSAIGDREEYVKQLMSETAGFAGCEILRRLLGAGRAEDMDTLESAQPDVFETGCRLLLSVHRIDSVFQLVNTALMLIH